MRKVMQTITGFGGNCESACIATLLGKTIDEVPSFWEGIDVETTDPACPIAGATYQKNLNNYLLSQGYRSISLGENRPQEWSKEWVCSISSGLVDTPILVAGISPRGHMHEVIYKNGELFHDPHPEGGGVDPCQIAFIVPVWKGAPE